MNRKADIPTLYQFRFSHFNEKARWALDYKGIAHTRRSLLPGAHIPVALWHSGKKQTPFLRIGTRSITGTAAIIDHLEQTHPRRALYPRALKARNEALAIQQRLDTEVGPALRRAFFYDIFDDGNHTAACFTQGFPSLVQQGYRLSFPALKPVLRADMRISRKTAEHGRQITQETFDYIARATERDGYLVDGRFTVADLTAACLLVPAILPESLQYPAPEPYSDSMQRWLARWADHPGAEWVRQMFRRHRGSSQEVGA